MEQLTEKSVLLNTIIIISFFALRLREAYPS